MNREKHRFPPISPWPFYGSYLVVVSLFVLFFGKRIMPEQLFIFAASGVLYVVWLKKKYQTIIPYLVAFLAYQSLRAAAAVSQLPVFVENIIFFEHRLFGLIPTVSLQQLLNDSSSRSLINSVLTYQYVTLFPTIALFALVLRAKRYNIFHFFTFTFTLLWYIGYLTYIFFPAMPPWLAAAQGALPAVERVTATVIPSMQTSHASSIYALMAPNEVAAIPSLHAAYSLLFLLISLLVRNKVMIILSALYTTTMFFAVVYLGEHYVTDVLLGILYAFVAFAIARFFIHYPKERSYLPTASS